MLKLFTLFSKIVEFTSTLYLRIVADCYVSQDSTVSIPKVNTNSTRCVFSPDFLMFLSKGLSICMYQNLFQVKQLELACVGIKYLTYSDMPSDYSRNIQICGLCFSFDLNLHVGTELTSW